MPTRRARAIRIGATRFALGATLFSWAGFAAGGPAGQAPDVAVKAALLYNFARFAEWPALSSGAPIAACIVGEDAIAGALVETVRGQHINGHKVDVVRPPNSGAWRLCHLLFIADAEARRSAGGLDVVRTLPVLTVSDDRGFSLARGIIELYVENGRMRFAINVEAAERSGLRLSSRLLGLARLVRSDDAR